MVNLNHKLSFNTHELVTIRECIHSVTIKGDNAWIVGKILDKLYGEIAKAERADKKQQEDDAAAQLTANVPPATGGEGDVVK